MKRFLMGVLALFAGLLVGGCANLGLIVIGQILIPPPGGEAETMEAFAKSLMEFQPLDFMFPFLAHALGTLLGAFVAAKIVSQNKMLFGLVVGMFFLLGGVSMVLQVGGPLWFIVLDLVVAYIPMGILGGMLAARLSARLAAGRSASGIT